MIKCAVIGASNEAIPMIKTVHDLGIYVIGMDGNADAEGLKYVDEAIITDLKDKENVANILKQKNISFVLPVPIGSILTTTGFVNDALGLKGIGFHAAVNCADKYKFHQLLHNKSLRNIECKLLKEYTKYTNIKFPKIIKPRFGSGSKSVRVLKKLDDLHIFLAENKSNDCEYILEDIIDGEEYGLDAIVIKNTIGIRLLRKKKNTPLPFRQSLGYITVSTVVNDDNKKLYSRVQAYMQDVINALNISDCVMHADIIVKDNNVCVIEMAGRPSGHYIHKELFKYATGGNIIEDFVKYCLEDTIKIFDNKIKLVAESFFDFENVKISSVPNEDLVMNNTNILSYYCTIKPGDYMMKIVDGHSVASRGYFIVQGDNEKEITDNIIKIKALFKFE